MKSKSRRKFLQDSMGLGAVTGSALLARPVMAQTAASASKVKGANDRIRVALIGCGGMGRGDLRDFLRAKNVECTGLCDVDDAQVKEAIKVIEKSDQRAPSFSTRDFRKVLELKEVDAVIVGTPDHWHALPTAEACK